MKKIYVMTKTRGFLINLFTYLNDDFKFIYEESNIYETDSKKKNFLSKLAKSSIADHLGLIQRIKMNDTFDLGDDIIAFSYNRFLDSKVPYIIYLESPLALVHYSTKRPKTYFGRLRLKKFFNDPNLKSIICLSKACFNTLTNFYDIPKNILIEQIYPLILDRNIESLDSIINKSYREHLNCLYISSDFNLKGGQDILMAFNKLNIDGLNNIKLKIITIIENLDEKSVGDIKKNPNIELFDFKFSKDELEKIYFESNILLNPSRQDSFSLVTLEAMKAGNVILTTDLYALIEMVQEEQNGFLIEPKYRFFKKDNMPNEEVWNNRERTIYSFYLDENIIDFLYEKLTELNNDRLKIEKMAINSFKKANYGEFSCEYLIKKWTGIFYSFK